MGHAKSAAYTRKTTLKRVIPNSAEASDDLIGNKIADKITKVLKTSPPKSLEKVKNENDKEISKEIYIYIYIYIYPEETQKIIDNQRLIQ